MSLRIGDVAPDWQAPAVSDEEARQRFPGARTALKPCLRVVSQPLRWGV